MNNEEEEKHIRRAVIRNSKGGRPSRRKTDSLEVVLTDIAHQLRRIADSLDRNVGD